MPSMGYPRLTIAAVCTEACEGHRNDSLNPEIHLLHFHLTCLSSWFFEWIFGKVHESLWLSQA